MNSQSEIQYWKDLAFWMADCHAANLEGLPKRTSKSELERLRSIAHKCSKYLSGTDSLSIHYQNLKEPTQTSIINRCQRNSQKDDI